MVVTIKYGFGCRLCEGNVLEPLTSIILNDNRLVNFVNMSVSVILFVFFLIITLYLQKKERENF